MAAGIQATSALKTDTIDLKRSDRLEHIEAVPLLGGTHNGHHKHREKTNTRATRRFQIQEHPVENFRPMRVIVIGAGLSGIFLGIRIPEWLRNVDLTIYDKNAGVGGTWFENRYPGCACDIPAHSYVYTFEPNPHWTSFYASAPEIRQYIEDVTKKYSVGRFLKLSHKVVGCDWDQRAKKWKVKVEAVDTGQIFDDEADVVIAARGALNDFKWPDIEGLQSFGGKLVHSAVWDEDFDYSHKRVGVIGLGSSAIQIVPHLRKLPGSKLSCFIRGRTWIAQSFGESAQQKLHLDHQTFTEEEKHAFIADPKGYHTFRKTIEKELNNVHAASLSGTEFSKNAQQAFTQIMQHRLSKRPDILDKILPGFSVGCRRLTPGPGFLEALCEDNVDFISESIRRVVPQGVELADGKVVELDVLVCATGFNAFGAPPFPVVGLDGQTLHDRYDPVPEAYLGLATDGFPNYFLIAGANTAIGSGSLTRMLEAQCEYVVKCVRKLQKEGIRGMHIKPERVADWQGYIEAYFPRTVYADDCKSWYKRDGRVHGLWPGSCLHAIEALRSPRWEDFEYLYDEPEDDSAAGNRMAWLGNGWAAPGLEADGDPAWYLEPEYVDFPNAPRPEETQRWKTLAFSH